MRRREREEYLDGSSDEWRLREHAVIDAEIEIQRRLEPAAHVSAHDVWEQVLFPKIDEGLLAG